MQTYIWLKMYDEIKKSAEEYLRQGYSINSIRTSIQQYNGEEIANIVINELLSEKSQLINPYIENFRTQNYSDESIKTIFVQKGYDSELIDYALNKSASNFKKNINYKILFLLIPIIMFGIIFFFATGSDESDFTGITEDSQTAISDYSFEVSLQNNQINQGDGLSLNLELLGEDISYVDAVLNVRDSSRFVIDTYELRIDTGVSQENIGIPSFRPGRYFLQILVQNQEKYNLEFQILGLDDDSSEVDTSVNDTRDIESDDINETPDQDSDVIDSVEIPDISEEIELEVASLIGHTPAGILSEEQIYRNAESMPLVYAVQFCGRFPPTIEEECLRRAKEANKIDTENCEMIFIMGREVCAAPLDPDNIRDSYCDYIDNENARLTCKNVVESYDGIIEIIQSSDLGLGFNLIVFYDGNLRQIDFADPDISED